MRSDTPGAAIGYGLRAYGGLDRLIASGAFPDISGDTVDAILAEAERFAAAELAPLSRAGDRTGATFADGKVAAPPGWREAYGRWCEAGWPAIGAPAAWGGQGMPVLVQMAVQEIWNGANPAFAVCSLLAPSAIHAIEAHASEELKRRYLPRLANGDWTATMDLTEPQAGSDLGAIGTRAERAADGTWRLFGQKIFITWGDHDLAENIVHLVLARIAGAPPGTVGISMFVVPKFLPDGGRNDMAVAGIEHKLGLRGSPTCTMIYGGGGSGAAAWIVGEENRGLACMFTMMNRARLKVGVQGVGVAAAACRRALAYARERRQGRAPGHAGGMRPIVEHPDIQRELLTMLALTESSRALCLACAGAMDMAGIAPAGERQEWADRASLLTPVVKAFATDAALAVTSACIQVHGGAGYIEETGVAQFYRDARIFPIYEGTNGIQAIDLVLRKLKLGEGAAIASLIGEIRDTAARIDGRIPELAAVAGQIAASADDLASATDFLARALEREETAVALAGAAPYLRLFGLASGLALLAEGAAGSGDGEAVALARHHAAALAGETAFLAGRVRQGSGIVVSGGEALGFRRAPE